MAKLITLAAIENKSEVAKATATPVYVSVLRGGQAVPEGQIAFLVPDKLPLSSLQQSEDKTDKKGNAKEGAIYAYLRVPATNGAVPTAALTVEDGENAIVKQFRFSGFNCFMNKDR